eukprot:GHRQ01037392.1.p1 GENE.GHRQ01037392.1~~GHRQ01037392.1.p1  ORF type:complete len:126 (-),score=42.75 GHRQ01037392.1:110-487(-)
MKGVARHSSGMPAYSRAKLSLLLFTFELQRRLRLAGAQVEAFAVHPGESDGQHVGVCVALPARSAGNAPSLRLAAYAAGSAVLPDSMLHLASQQSTSDDASILTHCCYCRFGTCAQCACVWACVP